MNFNTSKEHPNVIKFWKNHRIEIVYIFFHTSVHVSKEYSGQFLYYWPLECGCVPWIFSYRKLPEHVCWSTTKLSRHIIYSQRKPPPLAARSGTGECDPSGSPRTLPSESHVEMESAAAVSCRSPQKTFRSFSNPGNTHKLHRTPSFLSSIKVVSTFVPAQFFFEQNYPFCREKSHITEVSRAEYWALYFLYTSVCPLSTP